MLDDFAIHGTRLLIAAGLVLGYLAAAAFQFHRFRYARAVQRVPLPNPAVTASATARPIWVIYASQTGQAEAIARQTAKELAADGSVIRLARLDEPWLTQAAHARLLLFIVSTHGDGDAPDHAAAFVRQQVRNGPHAAVDGVPYGVLALGDRSYAHFCGFGKRLDQWLQASGARARFPRIESDRLDAASLAAWMQAIGSADAVPLRLADETTFAAWRLHAREQLNVGSLGAPLCKLTLHAVSSSSADWQAGDLAELILSDRSMAARTYSIASVPAEGALQLIVRTRVRADGQPGLMSGWLNTSGAIDDIVLLRLRANPGFRLEAGTDTPLILIGAGAGIAGLRAHLAAREQALGTAHLTAPKRCVWLLFGERSGVHDRPCRNDFIRWQRSGVLTRLDLSFSRDGTPAAYVQHALLAHAETLRDWLSHGACVLVCGDAQGMGKEVDEALRTTLGDDEVEALIAAGRLRRDLF